MHLPLTMRCTDNLSCYLINYDLRLESDAMVYVAMVRLMLQRLVSASGMT
jgi:hypothetical protein